MLEEQSYTVPIGGTLDWVSLNDSLVKPLLETTTCRIDEYRAFAEIHNSDDPEYEETVNSLMSEGQSRVWNNAIMELGGVACQKTPRCDEEGCPWRNWCHAYQTGDFTAPDVPTQPSFEGSRRQMHGRVVRSR
jgi:A/G-specific adenine glycosylase